MATTTNYGWTTPDDTALVKDGAAAIRTLGSSVDTTTKNLNPETTLGDIAYRSSTANVKTRLGLGTAGQVLTVNSGANAPEWTTPASGGMTLISTTTLANATTTLSSIPQTYNSLLLIISGVTANTSDSRIRCLPNNVNNLAETSVILESTVYAASNLPIRLTELNSLRTNNENIFVLQFFNYTSTTAYKPFSFDGFFVESTTAYSSTTGGGAFRSTTAITSLVFDYGGTNTFAGGTVLLYGVK